MKTKSVWPCWIKSLTPLLKDNGESGWKISDIFRGSTASVKEFKSHMSLLGPATMPHPPHEHEEEELIIMLSGEVDIITLENTGEIATRRIVTGCLVYHSAHQKHTIKCIGPEPAAYLIFKWTGAPDKRRGAGLQSSAFQIPSWSAGSSSRPAKEIQYTLVFESPTLYLRKLRCHLTTLQPGAGYLPHSDAHDTAVLTLGGSVETLGHLIEPHSIIFYPAGQLHGMKNPGAVPARYIVIEFHGSKIRRKLYSLTRTGIYLFQRIFRSNLRRMPLRAR